MFSKDTLALLTQVEAFQLGSSMSAVFLGTGFDVKWTLHSWKIYIPK